MPSIEIFSEMEVIEWKNVDRPEIDNSEEDFLKLLDEMCTNNQLRLRSRTVGRNPKIDAEEVYSSRAALKNFASYLQNILQEIQQLPKKHVKTSIVEHVWKCMQRHA